MDEHLLRLRPPVWLPLLVVLIAGGAYIIGKNIEVRGYTAATITVSGEGKVTAVPDIAELTFGMQTGPQPTAKIAHDKLAQSMTAAFNAVKALGIEEKDIALQALALQPSYDWSDGRQKLRGYEGSQTLRVKVRDLDLVSSVLSAATDAGANQAGDIQFMIDDPEALRAKARAAAIVKAQEKARVLVKDLHVQLGSLQSFSEGSGEVYPQPYMMRTMAADAAEVSASVPLPPGQQDITISVTLTYEVR